MKKALIILGILVVVADAGYFAWQKINSKTNLGQPPALPDIVKKEQPPTSKHPWSQFHGSYLHTPDMPG